MTAIKEKFLLARIRIFKDQLAFAEIHNEYYQRIYRFLRIKLPAKHDAEDAANVTFLRLWNYLCSSHVESLSGLTYTIARSVVAEFYRGQKSNLSLDDFISEEAEKGLGDQGSQQARMIAGTEIELIKIVIRGLSEEEQKLIYWRYFEGLSMKEIAKRIQKRESATKSAVYRALAHLKESLPPNQSEL